MTQEHFPPMAIKPAPEWVGEGDSRRDVSAMTDRALSITGLDLALRAVHTLQELSNKVLGFISEYDQSKVQLLRELPKIPDHERRIIALEAARLRAAGHDIPLQPGEERSAGSDSQPERKSYHEWDQILGSVSGELARRVKDPRDRMTSDRAAAIAKQVFKQVKTDEDAQTLRTIKSKGWSTALEIAKWVALLAAGALAAHYGLPVPGGH